jgi:hypothetical protein
MGLFDTNTLTQQLEKVFEPKKNSFGDDREWTLTTDEKGNGSAVIRLLPQKNINEVPIVKFYEHYIQFKDKTGKVKYFRAKSPQTIGKPCPVSDIYYELNAIGTEEAKNFARQISRKTKFASNIYVIKDNGNPDNNGKVFYWTYGVKLLDKIKAVLNPSDDLRDAGIQPINVFDPIDGANMILVRTKKSAKDFPNYDNTTFDKPSALFTDVNQAKEFIEKNCYDLNEIILGEDTFQTYEELLAKFKKAIAGTELEAFLIQNGSEIITEPYDEPGNPNKRLFKKTVTKINEIQSETISQSKIEETPKPKVEETPKPKVEEQKVSPTISDDDIDSLLDDL